MMSSTSPLQQYQNKLQLGLFQANSAQYQALLSLESGFLQQQKPINFWQKYLKPTPIHNYYLLGGIGRGKTWSMDAFYQGIPHSQKCRYHFYAFMQKIQSELQQHQGQSNPLEKIAHKMADRYRLLCLDEFFIHHIKEAMIIRRLFEVLLIKNIHLIITSNIAPSDLYKNGLQRQQFLPTIQLIQQRMQLLDFGQGQDFRIQDSSVLQYHYPLNNAAARALTDYFYRCSAGQHPKAAKIYLNQQPVAVIAQYQGCLWLSFASLCQAAYSELDYLILVQQTQFLILEHIPQLSANEDEQARRFISLIDIFYDHGVSLCISAAVEIEQLYIGEYLQADFQRTYSRLQEML